MLPNGAADKTASVKIMRCLRKMRIGVRRKKKRRKVGSGQIIDKTGLCSLRHFMQSYWQGSVCARSARKEIENQKSTALKQRYVPCCRDLVSNLSYASYKYREVSISTPFFLRQNASLVFFSILFRATCTCCVGVPFLSWRLSIPNFFSRIVFLRHRKSKRLHPMQRYQISKIDFPKGTSILNQAFQLASDTKLGAIKRR